MAEYTYDFTQADGAPTGLTVESGTASVVGNELVVTADGTVDIVVGDDVLTVDNYQADVDLTPGGSYGSSQRCGLILCYQDTGNYYYVSVKTGAFGGLYLYRVKAFSQTLLASDPLAGSRNIPAGSTFNIQADVSDITSDPSFTIFLDAVEIFSHTDSADPLNVPGQIGVYQNDVAGDDLVADNLHVLEGDANPVITIAEATQTIMAAKDELTYEFTANATATDVEDGDLTANIVWETSLDGGGFSNIGSGASVTYDFPIGSNVIRASVTDSSTNTSTDEITLTILEFDFGGTIPVVNGFIEGISGTHTADEYTGNGIRLMITRQPSNAQVFAGADGKLAIFPDDPSVTQVTFDYRIEDQEGFSNESTITIDIST